MLYEGVLVTVLVSLTLTTWAVRSKRFIIINSIYHSFEIMSLRWVIRVCLDQQGLDLVLDGVDLVLDGRTVVGGDRGSNNGSRDTTGSTKGSLGGHKHVGDVLVLAQQRKVQENLDGLGVGSHDDELGDTSVKSLGGLVGTLLQLLDTLGLLHKVKNLLGGVGVSQRKSLGVGSGHYWFGMRSGLKIYGEPCDETARRACRSGLYTAKQSRPR